jgi:endogenous inhibitor of DNA gyrase (YacG/DUF329 family)
MDVVSFSKAINDVLVPRCGRCGVVMDLIATRAARRHTLRTFCCRRCGNIDTISFDRKDPYRNDVA